MVKQISILKVVKNYIKYKKDTIMCDGFEIIKISQVMHNSHDTNRISFNDREFDLYTSLTNPVIKVVIKEIETNKIITILIDLVADWINLTPYIEAGFKLDFVDRLCQLVSDLKGREQCLFEDTQLVKSFKYDKNDISKHILLNDKVFNEIIK